MTASTSLALSSKGWMVSPGNFGELMQYATMLAQSSFCPSSMKNRPGDIIAAIQMGAEVGLAPIQALQNVCVINGKPSIYGDAMIALCLAHPSVEDVVESYDEKTMTAVCSVVRRRGDKTRTVTQSFSIEDAKKAKLDKKSGPWTDYPKRMIQMRARSWALRDACSDILKGLIAREEAEDIPVEVKAEVVSSRPITEKPAATVVLDEPSDMLAPQGFDTPKILAKKHPRYREENGRACALVSEMSDEELTRYTAGIRSMLDGYTQKGDAERTAFYAGAFKHLEEYIALRKAEEAPAAEPQAEAVAEVIGDREAQLKAAVESAPRRATEPELAPLDLHLCIAPDCVADDLDVRTWTNPESLIQYSTWLREHYAKPEKHARIQIVETRIQELIALEAEEAEKAL
jgi:hypothetical protein